MVKIVFIVVNSQEFGCDKEFIMNKSPAIKEYFEKNPKSDCFVCNIDSFQGNESIFKDFLNGKEIEITYDMIPFITSFSKVFKIQCFNDQIQFLENSYQNFLNDTDSHFLELENYSNHVINESYESILNELTFKNFHFFARTFLSLCVVRPSKTNEYINFLKKAETEKNILVYQEFEKLLEMKHFLFRFRDNFLSNFHSMLFLNHFESSIQNSKIKTVFNKNQNDIENDTSLKFASCLFSILENEDVDSLQIYISKPEFDINSRFYDVSLIEYSAFLSSIKCFKFLLNNHIQIDRNKIGAFAIAGANSEIIHICEQKGATFDNTLKIAVAFHHHELFNWLIETKNQFKITEEVVQNCFLYSNFTILKQLINEQRIPLNDILLLSAESSQLSLFELITNLPGIDIDHKNSKGQTSLHFGCLNDDSKLVNFILNCKLSSFVDVNSKIIHEDVSPLHITCQNGNIESTKLLLSHPKIDVNSETFYTNRMTPLHFACKFGNYEIVSLLVKNESIRINSLTYNHQTPFYYACKKGHLNIVKLLIECKADTNTINTKDSTTPILIACIHEHFDIVKFIISSKNVNDETKLGENLLLLASKSGNVEMIKFLLSNYKVDIHSRNKKGLNALHYACKGKDCPEIIAFLISVGCDYKEETRNCKIPLHYACKHGNYEQVCCLIKYDPALISKKDGKIIII